MQDLVAHTEEYRHSLISYIYRLTGSIEEAEDISQEALLKYISLDDKEIINVKAWLFKVATNLSWDFLKSAKYRHELYTGPWLPDPYTKEYNNIEQEAELDESLSMALFIMMEKLSPKERVSYVLHDIFDFTHIEISNIMHVSVENSRKLSSRARQKMKSGRHIHRPSEEEHLVFTKTFMLALKEGNTQQLIDLFADDIQFHNDGGGKVTAAQKIIYGKQAVIQFIIKIISKVFNTPHNNIYLETKYFNGKVGITMMHEGSVVTSFQLEIYDNKVVSIYVLRNPSKLKYLKK